MPLQRIEVNVTTGERKVIDLTPEEIADSQTRVSAENAERARPKPLTIEQRVAALEARIR